MTFASSNLVLNLFEPLPYPYLQFLLKGLELNPLELNTLYEHLYDLGKKLQTEDSMVVFENGFRPWPHVFKGRGRSKKFYSRVDSNLVEDLAH